MFLLLGEPDYASEDGQRFGYRWTKVKALWVGIAPGPYGGSDYLGVGEFTKTYVLQIEFGRDNRVVGVDVTKE